MTVLSESPAGQAQQRAAEHTYRPLLDILTGGRTLPDGYDEWGMRTVHVDFTSSNGFRWVSA